LVHDHQQEGADRHDRGFPLRFRRRRWLLGHPVPARELGVPHGRLTGHEDPDPDGVSTFRAHKLRPGWAPSIARGRWCSSRPTTIIGLRLSHHSDLSLHPATATHPCGVPLHEPSTRVQAIRPSGLPLACGSRMEREPLGFPPSFAPRPCGRRTSGRGRIIEHGPEICSTASAEPPTSRIYLNACDLVSHP
jgi:hypothetical protein